MEAIYLSDRILMVDVFNLKVIIFIEARYNITIVIIFQFIKIVVVFGNFPLRSTSY